jgi:O-antigen biosynthesis protein WbqP
LSIIGPRPVVLAEEGLIACRTDAGVYRVRPGLSGLAQTLGRDLLNDTEKTALDRFYVQHQSLFFDLRLVFFSLVVALFGHGIREGKGN